MIPPIRRKTRISSKISTTRSKAPARLAGGVTIALATWSEPLVAQTTGTAVVPFSEFVSDLTFAPADAYVGRSDVAVKRDERRPGGPRKIGDEKIAEVVTTTLETMLAAATHWSTRSMARATGVSPPTVHRIFGGRSRYSRRSETFKLSTDPLFVEKVRGIVGLYLDPPDRALVLCVDEKSQIQALPS